MTETACSSRGSGSVHDVRAFRSIPACRDTARRAGAGLVAPGRPRRGHAQRVDPAAIPHRASAL
ncbi:MAG: hypothetical protein QM604_10180 [Microbacterium sp.]